MATYSYSQNATTYHSTNHAATGSKVSRLVVPLGRVLLSLIFIISGINHFSGGTLEYAVAQGVPWANVLVPVSGVISLIGGLSVLIGAHARMGALLLIIFLIPVTVMMHNFWAIEDAQMAQNQLAHFMKNLSILGGALFIAFYGAGPMSWDHHQQKRHS